MVDEVVDADVGNQCAVQGPANVSCMFVPGGSSGTWFSHTRLTPAAPQYQSSPRPPFTHLPHNALSSVTLASPMSLSSCSWRADLSVPPLPLLPLS